MTALSMTYGGALFALACEEHNEERYLRELEMVCSILKFAPEYVRLIESRAISKDERLALLDEAFSGRIDVYLLNFLKLLCERGVFSKLMECAEAYECMYNEKFGIAAATATSAVAMSEEQIDRLKQALEEKTGKKIRLSVRIDPKLRGGLSVEVAGRRYDNTVMSKLERLRKALTAQS